MDLNPCILHLNLTLYAERYTAEFLYVDSLKIVLYETTVQHFETDCILVKCMHFA